VLRLPDPASQLEVAGMPSLERGVRHRPKIVGVLLLINISGTFADVLVALSLHPYTSSSSLPSRRSFAPLGIFQSHLLFLLFAVHKVGFW